MSTHSKRARQLGGWIVGEVLGHPGANGTVYRAAKDGASGAIKVLKKSVWSGVRYERFRREIEAMSLYQDIPGVLPLLAVNCPLTPTSQNRPWFVMAIAQPMTEALGPEPALQDVVSAVADIADTLSAVHARGGAHRDVKPDNLFKYLDRYAVGDFGLVEFPGQSALTLSGEKLGPMHYIAPEMLNTAHEADGRPADVFSLAKTLWVLATGQRFALPGQLDRTIPATTLSAYVRDIRARLLDRIVEEATAVEATRRPSMQTMARELRAWLAPPQAVLNDPLDLSALSQEIEAINQPHHNSERRTHAEHARITHDGERIRERFRPVVEAVGKALAQARFLGVDATIHDYDYGFLAKGHLLAGTWGAIELKLEGLILIPGPNEVEDIRVECWYTAVTLGRGTGEQRLWEGRASFVPEGSMEEREIQRLINRIQANFEPSVRRILEISRESHIGAKN